MIAPKVASATALEPYVVRVVFSDGEIRDVDIEPLLDGPVFMPLRDRYVFEQVRVDGQTHAVTWPGGVDLDSDVIYGVARAAGTPAAQITTRSPA